MEQHRMKIAYIAEWDAFNNSGVLTKLSSQVKIWRALDHEAHLFLVSPPQTKKSFYNESESDFTHIISSPYSNLFTKGRKYLNKIFSVRLLESHIKRFRPEIIYYRQGIWYPWLANVLDLAPCVMELNTDDVSEKKLLSWIEQKAYFYGRNRIIKKCDGFIAVSHEIAKLYQSYEKPIKVIANGINFDDKRPTYVVRKNKRPQFLFVGTPNQTWHGVDKIIELAKELNECDFHLVGSKNQRTPSNNIIYHGYLNQNQLKALYPKMDIGLGTLALHRKNMTEASPLKVREYLAFGLPVVLGFKDTDLEGCSFILNIGNNENNIIDHAENIYAFAKKWQGYHVARKEVEPLLSLKGKEKIRLKFFAGLIDNN